MFMRMNIVEAIPMTRCEYCNDRGIESPDEDCEGFKVVYSDGYVSWCPKDKFDAVSVSCAEGCVPFGYAIAECQYHGKKIKRVGWNGEDQYVEYRECATLNTEGVDLHSFCFVFHFKNRNTGETGVQVGWLASQADLQAKDWVIIED